MLLCGCNVLLGIYSSCQCHRLDAPRLGSDLYFWLLLELLCILVIGDMYLGVETCIRNCELDYMKDLH